MGRLPCTGGPASPSSGGSKPECGSFWFPPYPVSPGWSSRARYFLLPGAGTKTGIIFPYDLITRSGIDRLEEKAGFEIFSRCKSHLDDADIVIALLDGSQVDDGAAWEIGYFFAGNHPDRKLSGSDEQGREGETRILIRPPTLLAPGPVENRASAPHRVPGVSFATGRAFRRNTRWRQQKIPPGR